MNVDDAIQQRRTTKVLAKEPFPCDLDTRIVETLAELAGQAPFHRPCAKLHQVEQTSIVPWRLHMLDGKTCRSLRERLLLRPDCGKMPEMLAAAQALVIVTWLPNPSDDFTLLFAPTLENMEHIAAASAAAQNLLLAATGRGTLTYWSSGGPLRLPEAFDWLSIPKREIMLGALFLFDADTRDAETIPGNHAENRGPASTYSRWVELSETNMRS